MEGGAREGAGWARRRRGRGEEGAVDDTVEAGTAGRGRRKEEGGMNGSARIGGEEQYSG